MNDLANQAKEILNTIKYATLATVTPEGKPWNSPVVFDLDDKYNLYWYSDKENQHSKNVREKPHVLIVVYDSTAPLGAGNEVGKGVYIEADAEELTDRNEINMIRNIHKGKVVNDADNFLGNAIRRVYKATPKRVWMNDVETKDGKYIRDIRVEIDLV